MNRDACVLSPALWGAAEKARSGGGCAVPQSGPREADGAAPPPVGGLWDPGGAPRLLPAVEIQLQHLLEPGARSPS